MTVEMEVSEEPRGISICFIAKRQVPLRWMMHMTGIQRTLPSGMFWQNIYVMDKYYDVARQEVAEKALETNTEWILFVDTDVFIPSDTINRLMSHNEKVVTGVYWMKTNPPQPIIYKKLGGGPMWDIAPQEELIPIEGAGLGCCLIHRSVFENMPKPWFKCNWSYKDSQGRSINVNVGEDHYFFKKAKDHGFQPYCDSTVMCDHYDVVNDVFYPGDKVVREMSEKKLKNSENLHIAGAEKTILKQYMNPRVVFYNVSNVKFNGRSINNKPISGSETALIRMAHEMSRKACNTIVYCNCDGEGNYNGVEYLNFDKLSMREDCEIFVSSRNTDIFTSPHLPKAKKYILWAHDMPDCPGWSNIDKAIGKIDTIVFVSEYHRDIICKHFPCIPREKCTIVRNGLSEQLFAGAAAKDKYKLVYSTTPFRGLDTLLDVFPEVKKQVPEASLEIFSGMDIYNLEEGQHAELYQKAKAMDGVTYHGTVRQEELAKELNRCSVFAYPNKFAETSCIAAMENIRAGNPIVTTKLAALPETVGDCGVLIDIDPFTEEYKIEFTKQIVSLLRDQSRLHDLRQNCLNADSMDWSVRAQKMYETIGIDDCRVKVDKAKQLQQHKPINWYQESNKLQNNSEKCEQRQVKVKLGV